MAVRSRLLIHYTAALASALLLVACQSGGETDNVAGAEEPLSRGWEGWGGLPLDETLFYRIVHLGSELPVAVAAATLGTGVPLVLGNKVMPAPDHQLFKFKQQPNGQYLMKVKHSGAFIGAIDGGAKAGRIGTTGSNQGRMVILEPQEASIAYKILVVDSGLKWCMDGETERGSTVRNGPGAGKYYIIAQQ